jgi:hypothetical protein
MNRVTQVVAQAAAAVARARATYLVGGGSWPMPCFVTIDHKPPPRRPEVTIS